MNQTTKGAPGKSEAVPIQERKAIKQTPTLMDFGIETHYLHAGQVAAFSEPRQVTTVLGSCVAVCIWDQRRGIGGVNHFLLPRNGKNARSPRYGDTATRTLVQKLLALGARREDLRAKIFGGSRILQSVSGEGKDLGSKNVAMAKEILESEKIEVLATDVGGAKGRKLIFLTDTGQAFTKIL